MDRQTITVPVFYAEEHDRRWPFDAKLVEIIEWMTSKLKEIPDTARKDAVCKLRRVRTYDGDCCAIEISYSRQETDEEAIRRAAVNRN